MPTPVKDVLFQVTASAATPVPIIFPTTLIAKTEGTNAQVVIGAGVAATVLAANANRKFAQITNVTGGALHYKTGGVAASAANAIVPNNSTLNFDPDTIGEINQGAVSIFNNTAAPVTVYVYEE